MKDKLAKSSLSRKIQPEIKNDNFYWAINKIAKEEDIRTVLEIGSSSGEGSTEALVTGLRENPKNPTLFCIEVSKTRFAELEGRYANDSFVKCYNVSTVSLEEFADESEVIEFYNNVSTNLKVYPLEVVLGWLRENIEYVQRSGVEDRGIEKIKTENNIEYFDVVLIDGSEFSGKPEMDKVYGAKFIMLDDINTFKNYENHRRLLSDKSYILIEQNIFCRNGYSIFKKKSQDYLSSASDLGIHFFTIVLNGQPFIRYHIEVLAQLPFKWHWHIIEGVADLKHDSAWALQQGGHISDEVHRNGKSNDGTTEYLDELAEQYPENITLYRKPDGEFWDGKREMVNAPLTNIQEECLLWQIDVDELWSVEQICKARQAFVDNPDKTAAFYWCWYFVGENLVISTRNCYTQNPQQDWLRTWRFKPGYFWAAHEPPILVETLPDGKLQNIASVNAFLHDEMEQEGLVFQHFAYVTAEQLRFKEQYYGYRNAVSQWTALQSEKSFPVLLSQYFSWVSDRTMVDTAESLGIVPIAKKEASKDVWQFVQPEKLPVPTAAIGPKSPKIIIDAVFFQLYQTGIARVWRSLLEEWAKGSFAQHIIVLNRAETAPKIPGLWYRTVPKYDYANTDADRKMLQQVCDEERADLFISTYYTTPLSTTSVFMAYDMIPELMGWNSNDAMWREKHYGIKHASAYISISENTARDLSGCFPDVPLNSITVAHCGVFPQFSPASAEEINQFKTKYGISKPYFMLVGVGADYKNGILFFKAFSKFFTKQGFELVCTGSGVLLSTEFRTYTAGVIVHTLQLSDRELSVAYSGAVALVYPSKYEGFGLPVLEAMACGCPVITCPNASIPEVAGKAAIYVQDEDVDGLANALCEVQKPGVRNSLIGAGLKQAKKFSWSKMAKNISSALINATLIPLNLKEVNLIAFPDWSQAEESLGFELQEAIRAIATHPDKSKISLLIYTSNISEEDANLMLSGAVMNLMMEEDLEVTDGPEIGLVGELGEIQKSALLTRIQARIVLENENKEAIAATKAERIASFTLDSFSQERFAT